VSKANGWGIGFLALLDAGSFRSKANIRKNGYDWSFTKAQRHGEVLLFEFIVFGVLCALE
jgi:hypothetical protein